MWGPGMFFFGTGCCMGILHKVAETIRLLSILNRSFAECHGVLHLLTGGRTNPAGLRTAAAKKKMPKSGASIKWKVLFWDLSMPLTV